MDRRRFISILSVSSGALLFNNCKPPKDMIVPYINPVEYIKPGKPVMYSSVFSLKNAAFGIIVTTRDGRPVRIDGNENHPSNRGASSHLIQASIFDLYNPRRIRKPVVNGKNVNLNHALDFIAYKIYNVKNRKGTIRIVTDEHCSPSLRRLILEIESLFPGVKFVSYTPIKTIEALINSQLFALDGELVPDIEKSNLIVSIGNDFLGTDKLSLYYQSQFSKKRTEGNNFNLISIEPFLSLTGANSNEHYIISYESYELLLAIILYNITLSHKTVFSEIIINDIERIVQHYFNSGIHNFNDITNLSKIIADKLTSNKGKSIVWAGKNLSETAYTLVASINYLLGNMGIGKPFNPKNILPFSYEKLNEINSFYDELVNSEIDLLILADMDLFYYADNKLKTQLEKFPRENLISLSLYATQSTLSSSVDVPLAHYLESWGDAITHDGTYSVKQPVILPLNNDSISFEDFLIKIFYKKQIFLNNSLIHYDNQQSDLKNKILSGQFQSYYDYLKSYWLELTGSEEGIVQLLKTGIFPMQQIENKISFNQSRLITILKNFYINDCKLGTIDSGNDNGIYKIVKDVNVKDNQCKKFKCIISTSYTMFDGTFFENKLLHELPDPITKVTWQPVAMISEKLADEMNLSNGDIVRLQSTNALLELPVFLLPIIYDDTVIINYGFGKNNYHENAFRLIDSWDNSLNISEIIIEKTNKKIKLPIAQHIDKLSDSSRIILKQLNPALSPDAQNEAYSGKINNINYHNSLYKKYKYLGNKWGMVIDLNLCNGCSACILACQIENNIPLIGKEEILKGRQMHWLRINRYFQYKKNLIGFNFRNKLKKVYFLPILCQHCLNAPCESVCPVSASTHSPDGLNETTYNRCIGSRFCILNCPYNVRRFNYYDYSKQFKKPLNYGLNPNVTVRSRGVVEKCSFCVQRINEAKYKANDEGYEMLPDGYVKTACQQACPTGAISFGNMNDKSSEVSKKAKSGRSFYLLYELNTKPSIVYLNKISNDEN